MTITEALTQMITLKIDCNLTISIQKLNGEVKHVGSSHWWFLWLMTILLILTHPCCNSVWLCQFFSHAKCQKWHIEGIRLSSIKNIFNWCQFHPFSKSLTIPTVQQFEGATSHPKGIWESEDVHRFSAKFCPTIFFVDLFFPGKFQLTALNAGSTEKSRRRGFVRRRILTSSKVLWGVKHEFSVWYQEW